jgi:hypothetical protein
VALHCRLPHLRGWFGTGRYAVIERYLDRLASLSRLRSNCAFVRFWRDETLLVALHQENAYPFRHSLAAAFAYLPPETEFQLEDANVLATAILDRSRVLENEGEISDLLISDASLLPPLAGDRPTAFVDQLFRMLALALPIHGDGDKLSPNVPGTGAVLQALYDAHRESVLGTSTIASRP